MAKADLKQARDARLAALLAECPVIPVLTIARHADAVPLARALVAGGITALEITLRTPAALAAAQAIIAAVPTARVGLGTVLIPADLEQARAVGARFALSPGATPDLLAAAAQGELPFVPGIATASELMAARAAGFGVVKLFPAAQLGGLQAVRALAGPFPDARFCPTGGVSEASLADWLREPGVAAVGGSWLAPREAVAAGDWATITQIARRAAAIVRAARP